MTLGRENVHCNGGMDTWRAEYGYYHPTGQLASVRYNDQPAIYYAYDASNNLVGEPPVPPSDGALHRGPRRLYLNETDATEEPATYGGTWTSTSGAATAQMSPTREGSPVETTVATASCAVGDKIPVTTFVSTPLTEARTLAADEQVRMVVAARQSESGDALKAVASLWVMDSSGASRCQIAVDHDLAQPPLPEDPAGISAFLPLTTDNGQLTTPCSAGTALQPGDRIVFEIGYQCTSSTAVEGAISRGGTGPALTAGEDPSAHQCGQPGYVELDGDWAFAADAPVPCETDNQQFVTSRRLHSVTIGSGNRATAASLTESDGTQREYEYTYDSNGALDTKTDTLTGEVTDYDYDHFGNLRHVTLPDDRTIDYLIDATNRRVGRVLKDPLGNVIEEKRWLYQSALRPVAELDGNNQVTAFFVYADKPNVPEYMDKGGEKYRIITDHLGSVRLVVKVSDGTIAQRIDYDEHGNVTQDTNPGFQPFGFAGGGVELGATGVRFGRRSYLPELARWASTDPIGFGGGASNLSSYVNGDPMNRIDPSGLCEQPVGLQAGEVGVCIETFIAGASLGVPGYTADNRSFSSNGGSFRTSDRFIVQPDGAVPDVSTQLGKTFGVVPGIGQVSHSSFVNLVDGTMSAGADARTLSPWPPFNINYNLRLTVLGNDLSVRGTHDGFPSYEVWAHELGKDPRLLYSHEETNVLDLRGCCDQIVP